MTQHAEAWLPRFNEGESAPRVLSEAATDLGWDSHPERTLSVARAIYLRLPEAARLWIARDAFEAADPGRLATLLAA